MELIQRLLDRALIVLFEKIPGLNWLNGHKRTIGDVLLVVAAALYAAQDQFPGVQGLDQALAIVGALMRWAGVAHAEAKARAGR
jgi:hypothetical protein